jgi:hypothetical protein
MPFFIRFPGPTAQPLGAQMVLFMKYRLWLPLIFIYFMFVGCIHSGTTIHDDRLIGEWATEKLMSQLGESQSYIKFKEDGTFVIRTTLFQMKQTLSSAGAFSTDGDVLYFHGADKSTKQSFYIENGMLTIHEDSGDTFKYKKLTK